MKTFQQLYDEMLELERWENEGGRCLAADAFVSLAPTASSTKSLVPENAHTAKGTVQADNNGLIRKEARRNMNINMPATRSRDFNSKSVNRNGYGKQTAPNTSPSDVAARHSEVYRIERLHEAAVRMSRGLLQYATQCSLWTNAREAERLDQLRRLAAKQWDSIQQLCNLLTESRKAIDWGVFPVEFTYYNYVAVDFLWPRIADDQAKVIELLEAVREEVQHDDRMASVLEKVIQAERDILSELKSSVPAQEGPIPGKNARAVGDLRRTSTQWPEKQRGQAPRPREMRSGGVEIRSNPIKRPDSKTDRTAFVE